MITVNASTNLKWKLGVEYTSRREAMSLLKSEKMKLSLAKRAAVRAATVFWEKVAITPKWIDQGVHMLTGIYDEYQAI